MTDEVNLRQIIGALRELANRHANNMPVTPREIQKAKSIAAKCYLAHNNRKITLNNEQFDMVISILRIEDKL